MSASPNSIAVVSFGAFQLNLASGELRRQGALVKLQPQPAKILVLLVAHAGQIVPRTEIARQVWGTETFVDFEHGLNFAIRQIRAALEDDSEQPRFLETLPKRGYRFIAPVSVAGEPPSSQPRPAEMPPASAAYKDEHALPPARRHRHLLPAVGLLAIMILTVSLLAWRQHLRRQSSNRAIVLAVLPFDDLSPHPEPYLVEGLTEEMIARLTRINPERMKVIARTSAMQYANTKKSAREIGHELGADYILENSIRREGMRLRITAQLVRASDQTHLWAETYEREMVQLLPLESEVTQAIAEQIHIQLAPATATHATSNQRSVNPSAHELYLQGRYYFNQRSRAGLESSIALYMQALAKDPSYADAYAGLADSYNVQAFYGFDPTMNSTSQAKIAAYQALRIDDSNAAAHAALAYTEFMWRENWAAAGQEFRRALELDDNYVPAHQWFALYLAAQGRMEESLQQMRFAQKIDPLSPSVHAGLAYIEYFNRDYDQAAEQAQVALHLNPNLMVAHAVLGWSYLEQKQFPAAIKELETAITLSGGVPVYRGALGRAYALSGNATAAKKVLADMEAAETEPRGAGSVLAALCLATGDSERALRWLEQTAPGDIQANWLRVDPAFDTLRTNPRFAAVVARMGDPHASTP